ncbi:hypothetical protein KBD18_01585 [Patescibacteria group bacterium]|nr:hypothetical protein [Patescibacteria group bacterium]
MTFGSSFRLAVSAFGTMLYAGLMFAIIGGGMLSNVVFNEKDSIRGIGGLTFFVFITSAVLYVCDMMARGNGGNPGTGRDQRPDLRVRSDAAHAIVSVLTAIGITVGWFLFVSIEARVAVGPMAAWAWSGVRIYDAWIAGKTLQIFRTSIAD